MTPPHKRQKAERRGRQAERFVSWYLWCKGWTPLATRYRCAYGEIDLIMGKKGRLLFVEVKYTAQPVGCATDQQTDQLETILPRPHQQQRITNAAKYFLAENPSRAEDEMAFVVALVRRWGRIRFIYDDFSGI